MSFCYCGKRVQVSQENKIALLWLSRQAPFTSALESFCEFSSWLKYFLHMGHFKCEHFVLHIWDIRPIPIVHTTVRIILFISFAECVNGHRYFIGNVSI